MKALIFGAGFSAYILKSLTKENIKIIGCTDYLNLKNNSLFRRKNLETNKILSNKSYSYGSLHFKIKNAKFHDRVEYGGNSNIWGGTVNLNQIPVKILNILKKNKIKFVNLSFKNTGTISNKGEIYQMQSFDNKIVGIKNLKLKIKNGYLLSFYCKKKKIFTKIKFPKKKIKTLSVSKLFLCIGTVQLIDLLYRSKLIKDGDIIEFSEFSHKYKLKTIFSFYDTKALVIRYNFGRAIGHFLGIQFFSKFLKFFKFIPICIDQNFYMKKNNLKLKVKKGKLIELSAKKKFNTTFGESIHYCNMRVNNININNYLSKINPNITGIGMSFVNQKSPGPISNDIINDAFEKIKKNNIKINY